MQTLISSVVRNLIEKYGTNDPLSIAEEMGVHVVPWNFPDEVQGMYKYESRNQFIFINSSLSEKECNFVLAHELGHAILHPTHNTSFLRDNTLFSVNKFERQANTFAVELLLPDEIIHSYQDTRLTKQDIMRMQGVPTHLSHLKKI
ncbi:ImmA/IrrE family metallo-endopeptidase [Priestia aryabhattai]|uniref:ImmA/IrrE family metallo-endopeptidase n=1 Tax=Priestia aryabhattai TaxID=412384 RepID=UPI002E24CE5A|nr:ImmA/IrrE family metallo-endopeptidase [Priestia aryabhattai]MED4257736.1 ImmA/IrrE family metallo-endopeptidase [Priestia aryabhattai]